FVHSFHAVPDDKKIIAATTTYGEQVTAAIEFENIFATQFHPEKSGDVGLRVLKNFVEL
ncbi:MAG: imidazole glycerol phosphate synthase subunit HisH, partial [Selenomonadaceae bacterium]|nr:imidazole glycerol phosphate synthase subunit HisH [Selenomonadaceae bacterium]